MCEYSCSKSIDEKERRKLSLLLLDCWQHEYDKRPYRHFKFERLMLEERLCRNYDHPEDFSVLILFLTKRFLCSVKLVGLRISNENISLIDDFVRSFKRVQRLELKLMDLPTEFFQLLAHMAPNMSLRELSLEGSPLRDEDIGHLHAFITSSSTLRELNVSSCSINQYNFAQLADAIHKSSTLKICNLSYLLGCHLSLDGNKIAHVIASLIWQNKLQELVLENCGLMGEDMAIISEYLCEKCSKLQSLNVSYNKIGANGALEILKAISCSGTLKHLKLNGCSLVTHGGEVLAQNLSLCWSLESLELQRNNIGSEAVNMILLCMKKSCKLQKLYLFGNSFNTRTGNTLRRLLDAGILLQRGIDITATFDGALEAYRVIPWLV